MSEFDDILNGVIEDNDEKYLNQASKILALMVQQGIRNSGAYNAETGEIKSSDSYCYV